MAYLFRYRRLLSRTWILVFGSFIIGNIGESAKETIHNFKMMKKLELDFMMTNPITAFPGTELWDEAVKNGWVKKDFRWEDWEFGPMLNTDKLTKEEIKDLLDASYKSFYGDLSYFLFGKKALNILNPKFWRLFKVAPAFIVRGLKNFLIKI